MKGSNRTYDVVIAGAGPAGTAAAIAAASAGAKTLLLEKHTALGVPLSCAEGISLTGLTDVLGEVDPAWVSAPIHDAVVYSPDRSRLHIHHPDAGVVLDRKVFDRDLGVRAARAGALVRVESPVTGLLSNGQGFSGVRVQSPRGEEEIGARVIIAADGVESQVGRWAGLNTRLKLDRMDSGAQYLLAGIDADVGTLEFYFGKNVAPGGYAWVFPKGPGVANVGLVVTPTLASGISARAWLDDFVRSRFGAEFQQVEYMVGGIPAFYGHRLLRQQNVLLTGDAARLVDSITGAGIANALLSGHLAGGAAAAYCASGQQRDLDAYARAWRIRKGRQMRLYYWARKVFLRMSDMELNSVIATLGAQYAGQTLTHIDPIPLIKTVFRMQPALVRMARKLVWY
jgi:digeranylgeranylglycerophospholipid reductase